ncbi:MAG: DUF4129 domain-containing protein [Candidatus Bipolaricaulis sp.]|nr:DUF4129 domain-containing protein [Candidatus Bipolaricaulis sp.]
MRRSVLLLSLGLVSALIVIAILFAAGVERVTFTSGRPFDETLANRQLFSAPGAKPMEPLRPADLAVAYGLLAGIVLAIILFLQKNAGREGLPPRKGGRWIALLAVATVIGMVTVVLVFGVNWSPEADEEDASEEPGSSAITSNPLGPAEYQSIDDLFGTGGDDTGRGTAPSALVITGILAVVALGLGVALVVGLLRRKRRPPADDVTDAILAPVRAAVAELRLGRDARGAVEHCYRQMLTALAVRSKVDPCCLTPREFVAALAGVGLDGAAIGELSTLFEEVHYGHRPEEALAARALQCMTAITNAYPIPEATP